MFFEFVQFLIKYPDTSDEHFVTMYDRLLGEDNLEKATSLLDSVETGGPINIAATGLQNFFGVKSADKAQLEIILGNEMYKSLKPLFGGIISDSESKRIEKND